MHKYLPSKKFIYILGSVILAIIIIVIVKALPGTKLNNAQSTEIEKNSVFEQFMETDSDGDGLKDWEEALWKTDLNKVDTDGDGTSDGEEVKVYRDPLKTNTAGRGMEPNDKIDPKIIAENKKDEEEFRELTATEKLSQTLFSQYIASKNTGTLSNTNKQIILDTAISIATEVEPIKVYSISSIKTFDQINTESLKNYGNQLAIGVQNNTESVIEQELSVLAVAISEEDEEELARLNPAIKFYENIINIYLDMSVPAEIASQHLNIINNFVTIKSDVEKMKLLFSDPAQAVLGFGDYKTSVNKLITNYTTINKYFSTKGVTFLPTDPGYKLFNVVN